MQIVKHFALGQLGKIELDAIFFELLPVRFPCHTAAGFDRQLLCRVLLRRPLEREGFSCFLIRDLHAQGLNRVGKNGVAPVG